MTRRFYQPSTDDLQLLKSAAAAVPQNDAPAANEAATAVASLSPDAVDRAYLSGKLHVLLESAGPDLARTGAKKVVGDFNQALPLRRRRTPPNGPVEVQKWIARFPRFAAMTCAISVPEAHLGSGFLVGPDLVLTSRHVLDEVILHPDTAPRVQFIFDQELSASGVIVKPTPAIPLRATDWLVTDSETVESPELDFVVVRLATPPGVDDHLPTGIRSWVELPRKAPTIVTNLNVVALHRPRPDALVYSPGVVCAPPEGSFVQYTLCMLPGSSGSPVFDLGWELLAIHRQDVAGDAIGPSCTEGVLAHLVAARIPPKDWPDKPPFHLAVD